MPLGNSKPNAMLVRVYLYTNDFGRVDLLSNRFVLKIMVQNTMVQNDVRRQFTRSSIALPNSLTR